MIECNKYQTPVGQLHLEDYPKEVVEQFDDFINNIPFIKYLTSPNRPYAKDLQRNNEGKAIIDITHPHILEDMDYFRPSAIHFQKHGCFTFLRPNSNPNSEFGKWIREEIRRCWYGYVRESDGEWIPGDYYYYLNYCPIQLIKKLPNGQSIRTIDFPRVWDGQYFVQHYLYNARLNGHHASELASRGKGKSYMGAGLLAKRFKLGESENVTQKVQSLVTASDKKYIWGPNQILNMFKYYIDFQSQHTEFPRQLLTDSVQLLTWESGFKDKETGVRKGTQNAVVGVTTGINQDKLNGSRGVLYLIEEAGIFNNLNSLYQMIRPSVEDGSDVYGLIFLYGTAGDDMSDFTSLQEIMYNPDGYNQEKNINVWDKEGQGRRFFTFFYPAYLNRANCMDENGNSDVTKAVLEICQDRYTIKYNSTDINAITKRISQYPITPQEAILRARNNMFPITQLNERIIELDNNPQMFDESYIGELYMTSKGKVEFRPTNDVPIRDFPTKDNKVKGALEIFQMPEKDNNGNVFANRYILGHDPVDDDQADTMSLTSTFVLDLFTDKIVAEYTGRQEYADYNFEIVRLMCIFYNGRCLYEQNKKGIFSYFSQRNCLYLLADTPEYLRDKQVIKEIGYGNKAHPYDTKVYTPNGIKRWGDIQIGDMLYGSYGNITKVIDIPFNDITDIYEITLRDGRKVQASSNHLWNVIDWNGISKILSTSQILENYYRNKGKYKEFKYYIESNEGVDFENRELPLSAYFIGLMLGDGCFTKSRHHKANFAASIGDMEIYKTLIPYKVKTIDDRHHWIEVPNIGKILSELAIIDTKSHTKYIPDIYKYNSRQNRLELLRGLLDTDGCIGYGGNPEYVTVSYQLSEDVLEVARSLGINCNKQVHKNCYGNVYKIVFYTALRMFNLPRKYQRQEKTKTRAFKTAIVNIKYVGKKLSKCVTVDANDSCYLIEDFIKTHNSKGVNATASVNNYANERIKEWLIKPVTTIIEEDGEEREVTVPNLSFIKSRALLKELVLFNPDINVDRVRALGMLMLYREEKMIMYGGNPQSQNENNGSEGADDEFFSQNYDERYASKFSEDDI